MMEVNELDFNPVALATPGEDPRALEDAGSRAGMVRPYEDALEAAQARVSELTALMEATDRGDGFTELQVDHIRNGLAGPDALADARQAALNARRRLEQTRDRVSKGREAVMQRFKQDREPAFNEAEREVVRELWEALKPALEAHAKLREFDDHRRLIQGGAHAGYSMRSLQPPALLEWRGWVRRNLRLDLD